MVATAASWESFAEKVSIALSFTQSSQGDLALHWIITILMSVVNVGCDIDLRAQEK